MSTNHAEASSSKVTATRKPSLEFAEKVQIHKASRLENYLDYSILVSNNISMARDQLANERNWLTWFRLSCTLIILGFSILVQFRLPDPSDPTPRVATMADTGNSNRPVGFIFCAIGFLCFIVGLGKYFKNQRLLVKQATYVEAGWGSYVVVGILFLFVCTVMILASSAD